MVHAMDISGHINGLLDPHGIVLDHQGKRPLFFTEE